MVAFETFVVVVVRHLRRPVDVVVDPEKLRRHLPRLVVAAAVVDVADVEQPRVVEQLQLDSNENPRSVVVDILVISLEFPRD